MGCAGDINDGRCEMGFFKGITVISIGLIKVPVAIGMDLLTLGGTITDHGGSYTSEALNDIIDNASAFDD